MSVIFSKQCEYAIQALIYLSKKTETEWISIKEIADHLNIPQHFLGKIFQMLSNKRILKSKKGLQGGFCLSKPSSDINLKDIVDTIDGDAYSTACVAGFPNCSNDSPCPLHNSWKDLREGIVKMLKMRNLKQMADEISKPGYN